MRWPLHPQPLWRESLSSWLTRIARQYRIGLKDLILLIYNEPIDRVVLDFDPPDDFVNVLSNKTGLSCEKIFSLTDRGMFWPFSMQGLKPKNIRSSLINYASVSQSNLNTHF